MNTPEAQPAALPPPGRLMSVDALRGFDMFWILGAGSLAKTLQAISDNDWTSFLATQLTHVRWEGFRFYDLIFPLFLFLVGISIVFSLDKVRDEADRSKVFARIFQRSLALFLIGIFYYGGLSKPWPTIALGGVLHRIAACYLIASLLYLAFPQMRRLVMLSIVILVGYWAMLLWVPIPDIKLEPQEIQAIARSIQSDSPWAIARSVEQTTRGSFEEGRNLVNFVDFLFLPGRKAQTYYINEGLLSTLPAVVLTLIGIMTGCWLKQTSVAAATKAWRMGGVGLLLVVVGYLWSYEFPLIKRIWTSSFILVAGGYSLMLMAFFYWLVDVREWRRWCQPFVWMGANALTLYVLAEIVNFPQLALRFVGGDVRNFLDRQVVQGCGDLVAALVGLLLVVLLARFLYRRKIFLRV
jgi:predicted acyltransferase